MVPKFKAFHDNNTKKTGLKDSLNYSIDYLCKSLSWVQSFTAKQRFCWGLIASSSSCVDVTAENCDWLQNYSDVISELGKLFNTYSIEKKLSNNHRVIINSLPDDIATSHCVDITRYTYICL